MASQLLPVEDRGPGTKRRCHALRKVGSQGPAKVKGTPSGALCGMGVKMGANDMKSKRSVPLVQNHAFIHACLVDGRAAQLWQS